MIERWEERIKLYLMIHYTKSITRVRVQKTINYLGWIDWPKS